MAYDVIIVGAGSAGCVLAARLSEDVHCSVLLLEAGPDYPDASSLPLDIANGLRGISRSHDWGYYSDPDASGRALHLARGKLVGGCSATNGAAAVRGTPGDYDAWAMRGNAGWSFDEVLPYFRALECDVDCADRWHGRTGPLPIQRPPHATLTAVQRAFLEVCRTARYPSVADHNAPSAIGAGPVPQNLRDGVRQSTALTYLGPARHRVNLTVRSGVLVDHVLLEGRRAVGVRLAGPDEILAADRVVLAAGAYGSPAILMRSGLGPATHLRTLGIRVVEDIRGVGQNLIDHPTYILSYAAPPRTQAAELRAFQTALTLRSARAGDDQDLHIAPISTCPISLEVSPTGAYFRLLTSVVKPQSCGQVHLRAADPAAPPHIDLGYFTHPDDMPRLIEAVRVARRLAQLSPLADLVIQELVPGPQVGDTDTALGTAIRTRVGTYNHPVGTCCMGPDPEAGAVVDARGHVYGVEHLWVIDASIMPTIPAANTNLPTIMVAERCAAWLKEHG